MNQRPANMHAAALNDDGIVKVSALYKMIRECQKALEEIDESDSAVRFEIFGDWLLHDYKPGKPFIFTSRVLGL